MPEKNKSLFSDCCLDGMKCVSRSYSLKGYTGSYLCDWCKNVYEINEDRDNPLPEIIQKKDLLIHLVNNAAKRIYRNKECSNDCLSINVIGSTIFDSGMVCGEGEGEDILKCFDCGSLYFKKQSGHSLPNYDVLYARKYSGILSEGVLVSEVSKMFRYINHNQLKKLEQMLSD
ncbi:hypothetical protein HN385_02630 [archaeon]|jgi:hypothetical protein|nr:hypothetical protein [archaeon]MBT3450646.1 hypothetical protein [archaeon]MBT6868774.1 hypothetical protein [archaeon]MBT7193005.1 hypothetical protein [archaeon]MBT7380971.1 hypothetical protein [archaeon]